MEMDWPNTLFQAFVVAWVLIAYGIGVVILAWSDRVHTAWSSRAGAEGGVYIFVGVVMAIMLRPTGGDDPLRAWIPAATCLVITTLGLSIWTYARRRVHHRNRHAIETTPTPASN